MTTLHAGTTFLISDDAGQSQRHAGALLPGRALPVDARAARRRSDADRAVHAAPVAAREHACRRPTRACAAPPATRWRSLGGGSLTEDALVEDIRDHELRRREARLRPRFQGRAPTSRASSRSRASMQTGHHEAPPDVASARTAPGAGFSATSRTVSGSRRRSSSRRPRPRPATAPGARFAVHVPRHGSWHVKMEIHLRVDGDGFLLARARTTALRDASADHARRLREDAPTIETDHPILAAAYARASEDLIALRIKAAEAEGYEIAAGIPWYMTLFGRDSLIASYQSMLHDPSLARGTLRALAHLQGTREDPETLEEPGRILHEYRSGIATSARRKVPRFPYYGTIDATPLFLIVRLRVRARHGRPRARARAVGQRRARGALDRATTAIATATGSSNTRRRPGSWLQEHRLERLGGLGALPRRHDCASVDRARRGASLRGGRAAPGGRACARPGRARRATSSRDARSGSARAIDERFWLEDRGYYAEALDGDKRRVDALTSNPGHLLWAARRRRRARGGDRRAHCCRPSSSPASASARWGAARADSTP